MRLRISARKSDLARLQAYQVGNALLSKNPALEISYNFRESLGDKNLTDPLWKMPEKGVFTEDFVQDLLNQNTDLVVHSWKDLPTAFREGTKIVATLPRADQRDLLLFKKSSQERASRSRELNVFSSSPRRAYNLENFLKEFLPLNLNSVKFHNVRGNIQTRVRKLMEDPAIDALVLAKAAMDRLLAAEESEFRETRDFLRKCLRELNWVVLPLSINPNASAQGALAVEIKDGRPELEELLKSVHCSKTFQCVSEERRVLASYGGGCHQKIGVAVLPRYYGSVFFLRGLTDDGQVLSQKVILKPSPVEPKAAAKFAPEQLASSRELKVTRETFPLGTSHTAALSSATGVWVAKAEAMPTTAYHMEGKIVWTAGLQTWKKLAAQKVWVHGSAESLGEEEDPRLEQLHGEQISWVKLSHSEATRSPGKTNIATYKVTVSTESWSVGSRQAFFWHSGSQFLAALNASPGLNNQLRTKHHACGPGSTYKVLRDHLGPEADIQIYLDEEEWRSACSH